MLGVNKQQNKWLAILLPHKNMSQKWTNKVQFPRDNFILRCMDNQFSQSKSSGNPMISLELELVSPAEYEIGAEGTFTIAGIKLTQYFPTQVLNAETKEVDTEKTAAAQARIKDLYEKFGLDFSDFNPENPVLDFKGRLVWASMYDKVTEQRKSPTAEQLKAGKRQGDVLINPVTKLPMIRHEPAISEILGIAEL